MECGKRQMHPCRRSSREKVFALQHGVTLCLWFGRMSHYVEFLRRGSGLFCAERLRSCGLSTAAGLGSAAFHPIVSRTCGKRQEGKTLPLWWRRCPWNDWRGRTLFFFFLQGGSTVFFLRLAPKRAVSCRVLRSANCVYSLSPSERRFVLCVRVCVCNCG